MRALVTGAAGFIGTHLVKALNAIGADVLSLDPSQELRISARHNESGVRCQIQDLAVGFSRFTHVFHLGGRPGVQASWSPYGFPEYVEHNIRATHKLLDDCIQPEHPPKVIYASSSSVVGNGEYPISPYGVSKKAGEDLMRLYALRGVPTVSLRYFTVYGPGQRPDMAFRKWIDAALKGEPLTIYGDGEQSRAFTFVGDVVEATIRAAEVELPAGTVLDVGGPELHTMNEAVALLQELTQTTVRVKRCGTLPGDPARTVPNREQAYQLLAYSPATTLRRGLEQQIAWQRGQ